MNEIKIDIEKPEETGLEKKKVVVSAKKKSPSKSNRSSIKASKVKKGVKKSGPKKKKD